MAEAAAARREARRRRILENTENRMQKIFGLSKEDSKEEKSNDDINIPRVQMDNGFISNESCASIDKKPKDKDSNNILKKDNSSTNQEFPFSEPNVQYAESDNHFAFTHSNEQYCLKRDLKDCDNVKSYPTATFFNPAPSTRYQFSLLSTLFFSPLSCILLAIFVNVLLLTDFNFSSYKSIITPYIILAVTRFCFGNRTEGSQGSSMLVAALILCNIKPEIVNSLKKILDLCSDIPKDFAVYMTSFVLFNWIVSILWTGSNYIQFF